VDDDDRGPDDDLDDDEVVEQLSDLVDYIARSLVDEPGQVRVDIVEEDDRAIVLELTVAPDDLGKVIGRDGRTARAMRTLLAATSARQRRRAILEILE
jgi:predicted RNA-binding protein YlqC (UPF0109 family)